MQNSHDDCSHARFIAESMDDCIREIDCEWSYQCWVEYEFVSLSEGFWKWSPVEFKSVRKIFYAELFIVVFVIVFYAGVVIME